MKFRNVNKQHTEIIAVYANSILMRIAPVFYDSEYDIAFLNVFSFLINHFTTFTKTLQHHLITRTIMLDSTNLLHLIFRIIESVDVITTALAIAAESPTTIFIRLYGKCPVK